MAETDNMLSMKCLAILTIPALLAAQPTSLAQDLSAAKYTVIDVETTGLSPTKNRIIEMSAVRMTGTNVLFCKTWLINPETDIPAHSTRIHGISNKMTADAPVFGDVADEILATLSNSIVVAHNARFDWGFLSAELERAERPIPPSLLVDSITLAKHCFPGLSSYSMKNLSQKLELAAIPTHRAESDTLALTELFQKCLVILGTNLPSKTLEAFQTNRKQTAQR